MPVNGRPLILASSSPQRKRLMTAAGYAFETIEPDPQAECGICSRETPGELVARLARQKAADVAQQIRTRGAPGGDPRLIIACDTVAECLGQILGKPSDRAHARQMLKLLTGQRHRVYSGLCRWDPASGASHVRVARTTLAMDRLDDAALDEYLDSGEWQGKAGAFGYQDRAGWLHIVEGSESNVIGLPMELLAEMLAEATQAQHPGP